MAGVIITTVHGVGQKCMKIKESGSYDFRNIRKIRILPASAGRKKKIRYLDAVTAFDIETTLIRKYRQSVLYHWQFQIRSTTITGRTWEEFRLFYDKLNKEIPDDVYLVVFVHNLSYEFQYLKSIIPVDDLFAMDKRKILYFRSGKLEFRCSYLLTNMSLSRFTSSMKVKDKKLSGFDYRKQRFPWTAMSEEEIHYCINDVRGLQQAIKKKMLLDGDTLYTIPLTSTGYSRRLAKLALMPERKSIRKMLPDVEIFRALRDEFRGGDTHAHRINSNILIRARDDMPIESWDISSSYPSVMLTEKFPGKFYPAEPQYLINYINYGKACLFYISMTNIRLKDPQHGDPYLSKAKCMNIVNADYDNGRILKAESIRTCLNEIDFSIVYSEYDFDSYIVDQLWIADKKMLPDNFRKLLKETYEKKTQLKGIKGSEYEYNHSKALFNSYYGMMVQNPCKPDYIYNPEAGLISEDFDRSEQDLINEYQRTGWLPYQWGVWVTSYARLKLHKGIHCVDPLDFLYCDTDSVKCLGDNTAAFEQLNQEYLNDDLSALDPSGRRHYIGIFEKEENYRSFKTMGAKKYAYQDQEGKLHITISGVNKKLGAEELKSIERFKEGFIFRKAGGTESIYNDDPEIKEIRIQGHTLPIISNIAILESTYTLGLTEEYRRLLNFLNESDIRYSLHYER